MMKSTNTMMIALMMMMIMFSAASTTTMACRCFTEPTLDMMMQDASISVFHGMVVPHRSLFSSMTTASTNDNEYSVLIQKVYKNVCPNAGSGIKPYQMITIASSKNSCGVTSLSLDRKSTRLNSSHVD